MNEAELRDLLRKVSREEHPSDAFIDSLWSELEPLTRNDPSHSHTSRRSISSTTNGNRQVIDLRTRAQPERVRSGPIVSLAAAAAVLLIGLFAVLIQALVGPEQVASPPAPTPTAEKASPVPAVEPPMDQGSSPLARTCNRLLVESRVSAVLRPGVVTEATSYRSSGSVETDVTAIELRGVVTAIEQLSDSDDIRGDVRLRHELSSFAGALDQAILLVEMGEPSLAYESIDRAKSALGELASEPALEGCLESVS